VRGTCDVVGELRAPLVRPTNLPSSRARAHEKQKDQDQAIEIPELSVRNAAKSSERHTRRDFRASGIPCQQGFFAI
jgi:hypothetical protein